MGSPRGGRIDENDNKPKTNAQNNEIKSGQKYTRLAERYLGTFKTHGWGKRRRYVVGLILAKFFKRVRWRVRQTKPLKYKTDDTLGGNKLPGSFGPGIDQTLCGCDGQP